MMFAKLLSSCVLLTAQLHGGLDAPGASLDADSADVRKQLSELAQGDPLRYAKFVKAHANALPLADIGPRVLRLVKSDDPRVRGLARSVLWENGRDGELAGALAIAINRDLCGAHIVWLTDQIQPGQVYTKLLLKELRRHSESRVRVAALEATVRIAKDKRSIVNVLVSSLKGDVDVIVREAAVKALGRLGSAAKLAVPMLLSVLDKEKELRVRLEVARSLQRIEPANSTLQESLKRLEHSFRSQLGDSALERIASELESLIADQEALTKSTRRTYRDRILADLLD
jgi:HEAT repeat protein